MLLLFLGIALWAGVHLFPALFPRQRRALVTRLGLVPYKLLFATAIVLSIVIIVIGWRGTATQQFYQLPGSVVYVAYVCMLLTFILFVAARTQNSIKCYLRHPQLTGVVIWSAGHLLVNGDGRSLLLFGMIGIWAVLEILLINRRESHWERPPSVSRLHDLAVICGGIVLFALVWWLHPFLSGIKLAGTA